MVLGPRALVPRRIPALYLRPSRVRGAAHDHVATAERSDLIYGAY